MKVVIEARALSASASGVRTYTLQLIRHLSKLAGEKITVVYSSTAAHGQIGGVQELTVPLQREIFLPAWLNRRVPAALADNLPDIIHFTKADVPKNSIATTVVTIYDVIPLLLPKTQSLLRRLYWPSALHRAATVSDHIMTISQASKNDIVRTLNISPEKITVTPLAIDRDHFKPTESATVAQLRNRLLLPEHYILFVGTRDQRKNVAGLLRAFNNIKSNIPHHLVIAGKSANKLDNSEALAEKLNLTDRVMFLSQVTYADLPTLYSGAALFVWPSIYEGWGFPPQEAMACGVPVITSDGGSLPEVVGPAGLIVKFSEADLNKRIDDSFFIQSLGSAILRVITDEGKQTSMKAAGIIQAAKFTWGQVASHTWEVYQRLHQSKL